MQIDIFWRRLDLPGSDGCRFDLGLGEKTISGMALCLLDGRVMRMTYRVTLADDWSTRHTTVRGWDGDTRIDLRIRRDDHGRWWLNDRPHDGLAGLHDVDLGVTPATNTSAIRRLNLGSGQAAQTTAAWLDPSDWTLKPLVQSYHRVASDTYLYASPDHGYRAELNTDEDGVVRLYPGLWTAEP